jgi:hypothetical protein
MICPRCGTKIPDTASECPSCGMAAVFMSSGDSVTTSGPVIEPEVLESLDEAERTRFTPPAGQVGCSLGPGCGCVGLPLAVVAGVIVSSLVALLWVLSLGRVPASLLRLARQARRGFNRS